ncbi:hypothetical protein CEE34_01150 [Candidatus Aerophobetes bacterium Ae_b3a]|nr:MAG: hypothetical protein CEE34_01150 [Candidatus Aerophobetes bacterium Ae_b3a]
MISHIIEYFKIPHPLEKDKGNIVISAPIKLSEKYFRAWLDDKKSSGPADLPWISRVLISPEEARPEDEDLVKRFERNFEIEDNHSWGVTKLKIFLRFTAACVVGYFIYWTIFNFPWFWIPAAVFLEKILGDTLTKLFQGVVIAFIPGLSFIKNFVGAKRWIRANFRSQYTKIFRQFGRSSHQYFSKEVKKCLKNIRAAAEEENASIEMGTIENLLEEILHKPPVNSDFIQDWSRRLEELLRDLSQRAKAEIFLEGVIIKLDQLKRDLLLHYLEGFQMVPLKIATPNLSKKEFLPSLNYNFDLRLSLLGEGFKQKAKNLKDFLAETSSIRERIYSNFDSLKRAKGKRERVKLLESIEEGFENLRNIVGNFHLGDNPGVPHERGENLSDFYDGLYYLFGRTKLDISKGEKAIKAVLFRRLRLRSERQQRGRIEELRLRVERLLCQGISTKKAYQRISHFFSFFGVNLKRSLAFSGLVLFGFACFLNFKVVGPDEVLTTTYLRWGVKETATQKAPLFSRGVRAYKFGEGLPIFPKKELFWQLPPPLVYAHKIDFTQLQEFTAHMVFGAPIDSLYKKGLQLLAGAYGGYYQVVEIGFKFIANDREVWIKYDYDGKGTKRLARDVASVVDEWRGELFDFYESPLIDLQDEEEMEEVFSGSYFKKLWEEGRMEEIIKSQIFRSPLMTYQYGTYSEMIGPGIDLILRSLAREKLELEDSNLSRLEKEEKLAEIEDFESRVEKIKEDTLEIAREEYDVLRKQPEKFKKYLSDPESISELKGFETVWPAIQRIMLQHYITDKLIRTVKGELGEEEKEELLQVLRERIEENPYFSSLIEIREMKAGVIFMDSHGYRSFISKITKEII